MGFVGVRRDAIGSFFERGRQFFWGRPREILGLFGPRAKLNFLTIAAQLTVRRFSTADDNFARWLARQTTDRTVIRVFERIVEFSLGLQTHEVACAEVQAILHCILRYGLPTAPRGGCKAAVVDQLAAFLAAHQGDPGILGTSAGSGGVGGLFAITEDWPAVAGQQMIEIFLG